MADTDIPQTLLIGELLAAYRDGRVTPAAVIERALDRIDSAPERGIWISRVPRERVLDAARALAKRSMEGMPLYGIPFVIKDNIDLAGLPTTAACPDFAYRPERSANIVERLVSAGAIALGKTNLDQFATGLAGVRSPYGVCRNAFDSRYIAGGSSSGSAVAVALGLASFALGTDTAGSGRVPAAFNNVVGLKPTRGRFSMRGIVPACRSLDCPSIFALTADDTQRVAAAAEGFDAEDCFSREAQSPDTPQSRVDAVRFGVPQAEQLEFFGDEESARLFAAARQRLERLGGRAVAIDFAPYREAAKLLYEGPWIAERYAAIGGFIESHRNSLHAVTRSIIEAGAEIRAVDAYAGFYRLMELRRVTERVWREVDVLLTPTAGTIYSVEEVEADPVRLNSNLGYYTNFVNLLDLAAVAVPAGFRGDGLPFGVTLVARAWSDTRLLDLAARLQHASVTTLGALSWPMPVPLAIRPSPTPKPSREEMTIAVCGAHMEGLPLNHELTSRGGRLQQRARTAAHYRFYALPGGPPWRPGLVRVADGGAAIEVEVWSLPRAQFGAFIANVPPPLAIGTVTLEDGSHVKGFVCEAFAVDGGRDITSLGGWRRYLMSL